MVCLAENGLCEDALTDLGWLLLRCNIKNMFKSYEPKNYKGEKN